MIEEEDCGCRLNVGPERASIAFNCGEVDDFKLESSEEWESFYCPYCHKGYEFSVTTIIEMREKEL